MVDPVEKGGGQAAAFAAYEKGLHLARRQKGTTADPLEPSWGEPELLMNLAWSSLNQTMPDAAAADAYAQQALNLVPNWEDEVHAQASHADLRKTPEGRHRRAGCIPPDTREKIAAASAHTASLGLIVNW
jgi:hypothetical protein